MKFKGCQKQRETLLIQDIQPRQIDTLSETFFFYKRKYRIWTSPNQTTLGRRKSSNNKECLGNVLQVTKVKSV